MSDSVKLLFDNKIQLEKFPGRGGWTYARIDVAQDGRKPFGWRKVNGFIDDFEIRHLHLMPMGNGKLFISVKAEIRKKIKKEVGDWVNVVLYEDSPIEIPEDIPEDFILCLKDEPNAWKNFQNFSENEKKEYVNWIYSAKNGDKVVERMADSVNRIYRGEKF